MGKIDSISFSVSENGAFSFRSPSFAPEFAADSDLWRIFLDDGEIRELSVYSSSQKNPEITALPGGTDISYNRLTAENGALYDIGLTIHIRSDGGAIRFSADMENFSDARINELQLPFFSLDKTSCTPSEEILYAPEGLGARYPDPRTFILKSCHTEYMSADYKSVWYNASYPHCTGSQHAFSMPWFGIQSANRFLYIGRHDGFFRTSGFNIGTSPRNTPSQLLLSVSQYPAAIKGEKLHYGDIITAVFDGDWRDGADYYKKWCEQTWYKPGSVPSWINKMTGWQRIILKHQYGEIFFTYADLPRVYQEGMKYGINALLVFGWWKGRFDNNYPEYEADPALGGKEGLRRGIEDVQRLGGRVLLYSNGNLIDIKTKYYAEHGRDICSKDIDGNEYREHYRFSNDGTVLKTFGYKSFVTACHSVPEWRDKLMDTAKMKLGFGADSVFFDQLGCCVKLCFDTSHPHGNRIDEEADYRSRNIDSIKELLTSEKAIGSEWVADRLTTKIDFTHGCGMAMSYSPNVYPDIFRSTFPECVISNRGIHDEREDYRECLNYAFVHGLIFDAAVYRCRKTGMSGLEGYSNHIKSLLELRECYKEYFTSGTYESAYGLKLPPDIWAVKYTYDGNSILAVWNNSDKEYIVYGKPVSPKSIDVIKL